MADLSLKETVDCFKLILPFYVSSLRQYHEPLSGLTEPLNWVLKTRVGISSKADVNSNM